MRIVRKKNTTKKNNASHTKNNHVGGNAFPGGLPICKTTTPGRRPKQVGGPIHPGIANPKTAKAPKPMGSGPASFKIKRADQNNSLYQRPNKRSLKRK
jgi:hypothetical protein